MLTGEQIPHTGDLLKMTSNSSADEIERQMAPSSMLGNVDTYPGNSIDAIGPQCVLHKWLVISSTREAPFRRHFPQVKVKDQNYLYVQK